MNPIFYKPENAWAGDFFPFFKDGTYYLYYMLDWRQKGPDGESVPSDGRTARMYLVTTQDLTHFAEHGEMVPCGGQDEPDTYLGTGTVAEALGRYHMFYTGYNPHYAAQGKQAMSVLNAASDDLLRWEKIPADMFHSPGDTFIGRCGLSLSMPRACTTITIAPTCSAWGIGGTWSSASIPSESRRGTAWPAHRRARG
ncbi:MAG: hypothetical protein NT031_16655 [Planctomycetota bacterium]|nr:hypothetical protein [Planctomycetota bacterium]